ncbi:S1 family peptidase [Candidatus Colwellia aromaticivorans]|uniref:S1 family peptidase n=1 Tax=Candidatus Colwellia aromaticivorans TaxID=2267621 RepID=UPI000DF34B78|nr:serine protease [Candidatus Colwellia aromaticivorans]
MKALFTLVFIVLSSSSFATEQAEQLFNQLKPSLYQIKLIDKASGEKSSIGSGFQISEDGIIATNYHVISSYALHSKKYRIEYLNSEGDTGLLTLQSVDVINDLALVKRKIDTTSSDEISFFQLSKTAPHKGEQLFSLGNPHDLGMIVVPGTYNGLKKESFNERIHFTGSINSGMSGGPVVNKQAEVVGINVATSGNSIGFLVPHDKLQNLYQDFLLTPPESIELQMTAQLTANQNKLMTEILNSPWQAKTLGKHGVIPIIDVPFIRCWGDSNADKADALILTAVANCSLDENTYLSSRFFTGAMEIEFRYMQAKDIGANKFYHLYQQQIAHAGAGNRAGKDNVTQYQCHHDLVMPDNQMINNKSILCTRAYKKFPDLFDVLYLSASIDKNKQALVSHFTVAGIDQKNALAFTRKFMEAVSWN